MFSESWTTSLAALTVMYELIKPASDQSVAVWPAAH